MAAVSNPQPITQSDIVTMCEQFSKEFPDFYASELQPLIMRMKALQSEAESQKGLIAQERDEQLARIARERDENLTQLNLIKIEAQKKIEAGRAKVVAADAKIAAADAKINEGRAMQESGRAMQESGRAMQESAQKSIQNKLTLQFFAIFHGKTLPSDDQKEMIYATYLADGAIKTEKPIGGTAYVKIHSMNPVIKYLSEHPKVTRCNFTSYGQHIDDVQTLATYLVSPECRVTAMAFRASLAAEAKLILDTAKTARGETLKIQYL